jgi:hypothetical protein
MPHFLAVPFHMDIITMKNSIAIQHDHATFNNISNMSLKNDVKGTETDI